MKKETLKEFGKGIIAFANLVGGFSVINGMFGIAHNLPQGMITGIAIYTLIVFYTVGLTLINKGAE